MNKRRTIPINAIWAPLFMLVALVMFGCGGNQRPYDPIVSTSTTGTTVEDFTITPSTQTQTYNDQNTGNAPVFTFHLNANSIGGFTGPISLDVTSPTNSGAGDFTPSVPTTATISVAGGSQEFDLVVTADDPSLDVGSFTFVVNGHANGLTRSAQCTVTVVQESTRKPGN